MGQHMMSEDFDTIVSLLRKSGEGLDFQTLCRRLCLQDSAITPLLRGLARALENGEVVYTQGRFAAGAAEVRQEERYFKLFIDESGDLERVCLKHSLPDDFPKKALQFAGECRAREAEAIRKRPLLQDWIITIDSEDAQDLDDAISLRKTTSGWELGVHIADVSYYVPKGSPLDKEAYARGTSVYLNQRVIPMFPHELSDDLCSLNADRPKLAFSVFITLDRDGGVRAIRFERTAIQVARRFSYTGVNAILKGKKDPDAARLRDLCDLAKLIRRRRQERGSLEFEFPELRIELNEKGEPLGVTLPARGEAEMLIEDFMVLTNEQVALFLESKGVSLFRIHPEPNDEKLGEFVKYASAAGVRIALPKEKTPDAMQTMLKMIRGNEQEGILNTLFLRSLQKAVYSVDNQGHFGLACTQYTHFTSPIRRYPDLIAHRLLAASLAGEKAYSQKELKKIADQTSLLEQKAVEAEREYTRIKGARFLAGKTGEVFEGKIVSLTSFGMFVSLSPYGLDGLLHVSALRDDYYRLDTDGYTLTGARNKRSFALGESISVRLKGVDVDKGFIDLEPAPQTEETRAAAARTQRTQGGTRAARGDAGQGKKSSSGKKGNRPPARGEDASRKKESKRLAKNERTERDRARTAERKRVNERKGRTKRSL